MRYAHERSRQPMHPVRQLQLEHQEALRLLAEGRRQNTALLQDQQHLQAELAAARRELGRARSSHEELASRTVEASPTPEATRDRLLGRLADVLDDIHRGLRGSDPTSPWHAGMVGVARQVRLALAAEHAEVLGVAGDRFDPHLHEAVAAVPGEEGVITAVESHGLRVNGALVRPAKVIVSVGGSHA